jgi:hypothetical protein
MDLARERFKMCSDAEDRRRREMFMDLEFSCGIQWDPTIKRRREAKKRPCLTINRIPGFVGHVVNNMRQERPGIKITPLADGEKEQAEIRQGIIRHIEVNSQASTVYDTGFQQMCIGGLGWMRVVDDWAAPDSFDRELFIRWVPNQFSVYSDPDAMQPDWSDMKFAFVVEDLTPAEFKARYGAKYQAVSAANFQGIGDHGPYWFPGGKIRVAEYFHIEQEKDTLCELENGKTQVFSKLPKGMYYVENDSLFLEETGEYVGRTRPCYTPVVYWALISGLDILDEVKWKGNFIPLVPVIGNQTELDGEKIIVGMVRYAREPQRMYNYMYSSFVETVALAPKTQFIAAVDQIEGMEPEWEGANTDPTAVLRYKSKTAPNGAWQPPPQRQSATVDLGAFVQGLQMADQNLKSVFSIFEASLGQRGPQESGKAINARKVESETATYNWGDNFIRSLEYLGRILNDLLPFYYNRPGRLMQILREDDQRDQVTMNQPFIDAQGKEQHFDLTQGRYSVIITTGPSLATKRQESASNMLDLVKVWPELRAAAGPMIIREMDFPGKDAIAAQLEKTLPPELREPDENAPPIPPEAKDMMAKMQQQIQILSKLLQEATDAHAIEDRKQMWDTLRTQMHEEVQLAAAEMKAGVEQSKVLSQEIFKELERIYMRLDPALSASPGGSAQSVQPGQMQPSSVATPPTASGPTSSVGGA